MSALLTALAESGTREDLLAQIARLTEDRAHTAALHSARVAELLEANNREVEKRRIAERALEATSFQTRVGHWMQACFGPAISADRLERGDRLLEEVLELLQSGEYPVGRVAVLTAYVWSRQAGEPPQEVGGVEVTLAAYCLAHGIDKHKAGETELARIWTKVEAIRAKQAAKPTGSALPMAWANPAPAQEPVAVPTVADVWRDDPAADERWNAGCDFAMEQLCVVLGVEQENVQWEAATETVDGDVRAVLRNILEAAFGDDWPRPSAAPVSPAADSGEVERLISNAWDHLLNVDDRNSPEEYPEMALIQFDELARFMREVASASHTTAPQPCPTRGGKGYEQEWVGDDKGAAITECANCGGGGKASQPGGDVEQPRSHDGEIEELAQWLHDEGGFDDAWTHYTWPEHPDDDGRREGGYVKLVPSDVQAKFRDVARRLLRGRTLAHTAVPPQSSQLTWSVGESMTLATPSGAGYVIELFNDGTYGLRRHGEGISLHATEAAAKAAAQADYDERRHNPIHTAAEALRPTHRHVKRGSEYRVIGEAEAQVSTGDYRPDWTIERRIADGDHLTVYQGTDGKLWARFTDEFNDGRFEILPTPAGEG